MIRSALIPNIAPVHRHTFTIGAIRKYAKKLIAVGNSKPGGKLDTTELAAFTGIASLLLNLDEPLTNE